MRRDTLFYRLFSQSPTLLFDLLASPPTNASAYRFDSVAVKEPTFEIDGVFLPPANSDTKTIYFCEVQFQKDEQLYERLFSELFLYFYRQRAMFDDWQAVVIYPRRSLEQKITDPYESLLKSKRVHRIYLNELGDPTELPIEISLLKLTAYSETQAPKEARKLIDRVQQEENSNRQKAIIDLITTIMVYRFTEKSRQEVEAMLGLTLQETRFYQDAKEEGREEGERSLLLRLLKRRFGELPESVVSGVNRLSLEALDALAEALLDFGSIDEAVSWLLAQAEPLDTDEG